MSRETGGYLRLCINLTFYRLGLKKTSSYQSDLYGK